jgi:hypothetical protein
MQDASRLTKTCDKESGVDTLDRTKVDVSPVQKGIDDLIEDRDHDDDRDGIQVSGIAL